MSTPIFFLSFANDSISPLPALQHEEESIYSLLTPAANLQKIQLHKDSFASISSIGDYLLSYQNRVILFHYGGHSRNQHLFLNNCKANIDGIAEQLIQQKKLKLVFLNACSTCVQVSLLLKKGIPAVIASSGMIEDEISYLFAEHFYKAIANHFTISSAFKHSVGVVKTIYSEYPKIYRGLGKQDEKDKLPWGLYTLDYKYLDYKLIPKSNLLSEKNIIRDVDLEIDGNMNIGDKNSSNTDKYKSHNKIEQSKLSIKGDLNLGDYK